MSEEGSPLLPRSLARHYADEAARVAAGGALISRKRKKNPLVVAEAALEARNSGMPDVDNNNEDEVKCMIL
jgi:hypothetical protein